MRCRLLEPLKKAFVKGLGGLGVANQLVQPNAGVIIGDERTFCAGQTAAHGSRPLARNLGLRLKVGNDPTDLGPDEIVDVQQLALGTKHVRVTGPISARHVGNPPTDLGAPIAKLLDHGGVERFTDIFAGRSSGEL